MIAIESKKKFNWIFRVKYQLKNCLYRFEIFYPASNYFLNICFDINIKILTTFEEKYFFK